MQLPRAILSAVVVLFQEMTQHGIAMIVLTNGEKGKISRVTKKVPINS